MERLSISRIIGVFEAFLALVLLAVSMLDVEVGQWLGPVIIVWWCVLLLNLAVFPEKRLITVLTVFLSLYCTSAYLAAYYFDLYYPPFPSMTTYTTGTWLSFQALTLTYVLLLCIPVRWNKWIGECAHRLMADVREMPRFNILLCCAMLFGMALITLRQCTVIGWTTIIEANRRMFAHFVYATYDHNFQLIAISLSIILAIRAVCRPKNNETWLFLLPTLILYWLPTLIIGARKELFLVVVCLVSILFIAGISRKYLYLVFGMMVLLPIVKEGGLKYLFHEYILPQYYFLSLLQFPFQVDRTFADGSLFMLPNFLRPFPVESLASIFTNTGLPNVGYGAHPMAEAWIYSPDWCILVFALLTVSMLLVIYGLSRLYPGYGLLGFAYLIIWGRSEYWGHLFFIFYGGLLMWLLIDPLKNLRARMPRLPVLENEGTAAEVCCERSDY